MAKLFVSAIAMWQSIGVAGVRIAVSVESQVGQPIDNLSKNNFKVGFMGSSGSGAWLNQTVTEIETSGASHGFYMLFISNLSYGSFVTSWQGHNADSILTVEVKGQPKKGVQDQGQTLAINTPTTPL